MKPFVRKQGNMIKEEKWFSVVIDIPKRPNWRVGMSKEQVAQNEENSFKQYLESVYTEYPKDRLNWFEHNLNVWRQLWRVCEVSDILCILADIRYPTFHFAPSLYSYVTKDLKKPIVLILTKTDLVPSETIKLWVKFFNLHFPHMLVVPLCSFTQQSKIEAGLKRKVTRKKYLPVGVLGLLKACEEFEIKKRNKLISFDYTIPDKEYWIKLAEETRKERKQKKSKKKTADPTTNSTVKEQEVEEVYEDDDEEVPEDEGELIQLTEEEELGRPYHSKEENPFVTIGMIGHPNVGKSTLINALKGKKVVSTSATPGHTKHLQTIFLNDQLRLCDCPGLIFPALDMPKELQVLMGIFPIAQVREPYSAIQFLAEYLPVEDIFKLQHPDPDNPAWTAFYICEAYAIKRGYFTAKGARPDTYRAGNEILRDVVNGRLTLYFLPDTTKLNIDISNLLDSSSTDNNTTTTNPPQKEKNKSDSESDSEGLLDDNPFSALNSEAQ